MCVHEQFSRLDARQDLCQERDSRNRETSDQKSLSCSGTGTTCSQVQFQKIVECVAQDNRLYSNTFTGWKMFSAEVGATMGRLWDLMRKSSKDIPAV